MKRTLLTALLGCLSLYTPSLSSQEPQDRTFWRPVVMGTYGMVAAEHPLEALAGWEILEAGGNAFDAAAAVFYMTTVVEQHQAGMGGDAFMLAYVKELDRVVFINGTGPAPELATRSYFRELGSIPNSGPNATDVPGAVGGFDLALNTFGSMSYSQVLQPAIRAARDGHPLDFWASIYHERAVDKISEYPRSVQVLMPDGRPIAAGERFLQKDLASSMEKIVSGGADAFYRGDLAVQFDKIYRESVEKIDIDIELMKRGVNEGFSGGEKKRNEMLQLCLLDPKLAILDETDSGLDIDALRLVAKVVNDMRSATNSMILVTHYQRMLSYVVPDFVHVLIDGKIIKSGKEDLAYELEEKGYEWISEPLAS